MNSLNMENEAVRPPNADIGGTVDTTLRRTVRRCWLGWVLIAASSEGVAAILFGDNPDELMGEFREIFPEWRRVESNDEFEQLADEVVTFVETPADRLRVPLDMAGSAFQRRIWRALREIPAGTTASYKDIATRIGAPNAARAVARACASNVLAMAVPCHRVVRADGSLSGYRWGIERKRRLLDREAAS